MLRGGGGGQRNQRNRRNRVKAHRCAAASIRGPVLSLPPPPEGGSNGAVGRGHCGGRPGSMASTVAVALCVADGAAAVRLSRRRLTVRTRSPLGGDVYRGGQEAGQVFVGAICFRERPEGLV